MSWSGRLLVATPELTEPTFSRTVVLLLQHGAEEGALGVVVNRPSGTALGEVLPSWAPYAAEPDLVFTGGPVQPEAAICLGLRLPGASDGPAVAALPGDPALATVDLDASPDEVAGGLRAVRVFAGYAGWSPGQLEDEVTAGGWWVLEGLPGDAFSTDPGTLWRQVLRRQGMPLALVSTAPEDPSLN